MGKPFRIGVVAQRLDGEYYGKVLASILKAVHSRNGQLIAVEIADDDLETASTERPVSFQLADAWILIMPTAGDALLQRFGQSGKPVVCVGFPPPGDEYAVLVDGRGGMKKAVLHLLDHGHRRIAFVGQREQYDLYERYIGYVEALAERGIPVDPELVRSASDNLFEGGMKAVEGLLLEGIDFTAIAAGTDLNAIGAIGALRKGGLSVPGDVSVTGFDDISQSAIHIPPLTTLRQSFDQLGERAVGKAFELLEYGATPFRVDYVPVAFVPRSSCGCVQNFEVNREELVRTRQSLSDLRTTIHQVTNSYFRMTNGLIQGIKSESIHIASLYWDSSHWGCLALWETDAGGGRSLVVRQTFSRRGEPVPREGERCALEQFPPAEWLPPSAGPGKDELVIVHPIRSELQEWGYLVMVGPFSPANHYAASDMSRQSCLILAVTLEREKLWGRIRSMAEKLEVVSRTTNDGIWDWDLGTNRIEWNLGMDKVLSRSSAKLTDKPISFLRLIHPSDSVKVREALAPPYPEGRPLQLEFRIRGQEGNDIWLYMAGDIIRNDEGRAVRMIGSVTDITEKKAAEAEIMRLAYHDALTGLPNRLLFRERLKEAIVQAKKAGGKLFVLMIDLDRFKIINDTLGHQAGDRLLCKVAATLQATLGAKDTISRLGGDEFIVLLPRAKALEDVRRITELMLKQLEQPFMLAGQELYVSASIGTSMYPDQAGDADTLVKYADMAMYQAKANGGSGMRVYTPDLGTQNAERFEMEKGLHKALEREQFRLVFQPQIALGTGAVYGAEALVRWESEDRVIPPCEFIPLAEDTGLVVPIGLWVLRQACAEARRWADAGMAELVVSVNLSAQQLETNDFPATVRKVLEETGVAPNRLCLEITEYSAVQNLDRCIKLLKELTDIGVIIAIDDFGTGQSPLVLLKRFPVQTIKIDPSFVRDMSEDSGGEAIVRAVIAMSHSLGLTVTAEGVETEEQLEILHRMECDRIQGYYTGRPMASDAFVAYYRGVASGVSSWES
ncbi:EAL domain-containing protein [Cohnella faecalis]|uniref:EAL domain-containing protein n=1 Tax=Cohnella faecalis TaxID=2315694 RepID=A0A398CSH9_9BACL|nr:EAL domain-containing protein [Cohnella faecalis]RIE01904.1 EAL domain-containing protein [Cohnella faecalis]